MAVIPYEEALYQMYAPLPLALPLIRCYCRPVLLTCILVAAAASRLNISLATRVCCMLQTLPNPAVIVGQGLIAVRCHHCPPAKPINCRILHARRMTLHPVIISYTHPVWAQRERNSARSLLEC